MKELKEQKQAAERRREELRSEVEMAKLLGNKEWLDQCNEELGVIEFKLEELEDKIIASEKKETAKGIFLEKYPFQYAYDRLKTMSDAELLKIGAKQFESRREKIISLRQSREAVQNKMTSLLEDRQKLLIRAGEIEKEFKETHDRRLFEEATVIAAKKGELNQDLESLKKQIKDMDDELKELNSSKIRPEYIREKAIAELDGKYTDNTFSAVYDYVESKHPATLGEITEKLNSETSAQNEMFERVKFFKSKLYGLYADVLSIPSSVEFDDMSEYGHISTVKYSSIETMIEELQKVVDSEYDKGTSAEIRTYCHTALHELTRIRESLEELMPNIKTTEEAKEKNLQGNKMVTYIEPTMDHETLMDEEKKIKLRFISAMVALDRAKIAISYVLMAKFYSIEEVDKIIEDRYLSDKKVYMDILSGYERYARAVQEGINPSAPEYEGVMRAFGDFNNSRNEMKETFEAVKGDIIGAVRKVREFAEGNELVGVVKDLSELTPSKPGEYTVDDLERAMYVHECLAEFEEFAKKEAQVEKDKIVASGELSDMITDEDVATYYVNPKFKK